MKTGSYILRAAVAAAFAAALTVVPSLATANGAAAKASSRTAARHAAETAHSSRGALRAPARPLSTHPKVARGYVAPTSSSSLLEAAGPSSTFATAAAVASARTWGVPGATTSTLVLYDTTTTYGWLGELYAMGAGNLASHFGRITAEPVVDYQAGQLNDFSAAIYLGSTYNEPIPVSFLNDVLATTKPVVWAGDNVWQLAGTAEAAQAFQTAYGWDPSTSYFDDVDSITQVAYNGQTLTRNPNAGLVIAPHITSTTGQVTVLGQAQCGTVAAPVACAPIAQTPVGSTTFPWAIRSANLTYIGEIPLSYMNETDRYLAFSDLLFSVLQPAAPAVHQALVRLEDVSPGINTPAKLRATADYLSSVNVPFSVAVIPAYADPNGFYNGGAPQFMDISQTNSTTIAAFNNALRYMVSKGGTLIEHGNTHQYSNVANPYSGVSGDDFEFYRSQCATTSTPPFTFHSPCLDSDWIIQEGPLPNDSAAFAASRAAAGQQLFTQAGLVTPTIWETPHYSASAADYAGFNQVFQTRYEREQFFGGQLSGITANASHVFGQFFPYVISDVYGTTMIPESIANFAPEAVNHNAARLPAAIIANARAELAVRQGVASFFFHPYYAIDNLKQIVEGIQALGYTFVAPSALLPASSAPAVTQISPTSGPAGGGTRVTISGTGLAGASSVRFGTTAATLVSNTATQVVATSPAGTAGTVDVTVTTPGGTSSVVAADRFTYIASTTTSLTSSPNPITVGHAVTFTASVTSSRAGTASITGTVRFTDGGATISGCDAVGLTGGNATCTVTYFARARHTIVATYSGNALFTASSGKLIIKVTR